MNNHWGTNYRAYQDQPTLFRYAVRPYQGAQSNADSTRAATRHAQPLLALLGRGPAPSGQSLLTVASTSVTVTGLKPADDGGGFILRLFNTSEKPAEASLSEPDLKFYLSSTTEKAGKRIENNHLIFKPFELMTIRGEYLQLAIK
jgi:alpha-mannosidase